MGGSSRSLRSSLPLSGSSLRRETVTCVVVIVQFTDFSQFLGGLSKGLEWDIREHGLHVSSLLISKPLHR